MKRRRGAAAELVPGRLYQRGQVLTWKRDKKAALLAEHNVGVVVNFWEKLDPDLSDLGLDWYLYVPLPGGGAMTRPHIHLAADAVTNYLRQEDKAALILCEAGVTRSVFFAVLVRSRLLGEPEAVALAEVEAAIKRKVKLKPALRRALGS